MYDTVLLRYNLSLGSCNFHIGFDFLFISWTSSKVFGSGKPTVSGNSKAHSPPTVPNAPNNIMGSFSSTLPVVIRYLPVTSMKMIINS